MKTIGQIRQTITNRLHGTTLNDVGDFNTICQDAAETMLLRIDPQETTRKALLANAIYSHVYDYAIPSDFKAPVNLNKQVPYPNNDSLSRTYSRQFSNQRKDNQFAIVWRNGVQYLRFSKFLKAPVTLDKADSLTENGAWTVGGNASGLVLDTLNFVSGTGSLKCSVSSPGTVQNVILRIGNDSSNYYSKTVTTGHFDAFTTGFNLLRFDLADAVATGSVDMSTIAYLRVTVTYNSGQTAYYEKTLTNSVDLSGDAGDYLSDGAIFTYVDFSTLSSLSTLRLDNITAGIGTLYDMDYYSNALFKSASTGSWITAPTSDNDTVNLSTLSYKIFEAEISRQITQQVQGAMGAFDFAYWNLELEGDGDTKLGLYDQYMQQFPSERFEAQTDYYNITDDFGDVYGNGDIDGLPRSYFT